MRVQKDLEDRQLQWEQREVELERIIANMEHVQAEIARAAAQIEGASGEFVALVKFIHIQSDYLAAASIVHLLHYIIFL